MAGPQGSNLQATSHKRLRHVAIVLLSVALISLLVAVAGSSHPIPQSNSSLISQASPGNNSGQYYSFTRSYTGLPYDEQSGVTFTQDFSSLTFNVTAVAQTGPDGNGPGYLLSALTDAGYWYQTGLSWKWPNTNGGTLSGFSMNYEVFDYFGRSIYPVDGGGGISNMTVNAGDSVLLSLNFNAGNVIMQAYDWNTGSNATQSYNSVGATYFIGQPNSVSQNGFFTGIMTEEYHSSPYRGSGQLVVYSDLEFNYSSAWLWIDEFNTATGQGVFASRTPSPAILNSTTSPVYFSSNGTAEVANNHEIVTGLQPLHPISLHITSLAVSHPGQPVTFNLILQNSDQSAIGKLTRLRVITDFGSYNVSDAVDVASGDSSQSITITVPGGTASGNHGVTLLGTLEVYDLQLNEWISLGPTQTSTVLAVSSQVSTQQTGTTGLLDSLRALFPAILAGIVVGVVAIVAIVAFSRGRMRVNAKSNELLLQHLTYCTQCGNQVTIGTRFCSNCGTPINSGIQTQ